VEAARQAELPLPAAAVLFLQQGLPWEAAGLLADWQPYLDDPAWGIQATEQAEFYHAFWDAGVVEGRRLGIPALRSAQFLYYNRTWAGELGFKTPPADPQGFADQACAAAAALRRDDSTENDAFGGWVANANDAAALGWIYAFGGQVYDGKQYSFNMPQVEQALTFQRELYDGACAWFDESGSAAQAFAQRQALFASGSLMGIPEQAEALRQAGRGDEWTVIAFPSPEAAPAITGYGPDFLLFQSSPEQQLAAWLFVRWLSQPAQHARLVEAGGSFPLQAAELEPLTGYRARYPAYEAALGLIPAARSEPAAASWETVRWVLGDAATQLFRPYFSAEQIPNMLAYLERTVQDILAGPQDAGVWSTSTPTLGPSPTP
ncbi:MAG: extracellular solute-binding protein, partial [Chloroflexota bacterium]